MLRCLAKTAIWIATLGLGVTLVPLAYAAPAAESYCADKGMRYLYHAYYRKVADEDPGTVHLFVCNPTPRQLTVHGTRLNGLEMAEMPNDLAVWHQTVPDVLRPGEVADVMIKLRRPALKPMRVSVEIGNGTEVSVVVEPVPSALKFTFVGYSEEKNKVYLYLENQGRKSLDIEKVFCNLKEVTSDCYMPEACIAATDKTLVVLSVKRALRPGAYVAFKVLTKQGVAAAASSRVYSYFPITAFGGDTRAQFGFDAGPFEMKHPGASKYAFQALRMQPAWKAYHVLNDPVCRDAQSHSLIGSQVREIAARAKECYENDPVHPSLIYICERFKPYGYYVYGETVDVVAVDPYEMYYHHEQPLKDSEYVALAKKSTEPRLLWSIPQAFDDTQERRFPTPEEERLIVYSEIGEGSKGIWYFTCKPRVGYPASSQLETEIGKINQELRFLRNYIVVSERFPLATLAERKVKAYSLLCGDKAIVLILLNTDHKSRFGEGSVLFSHTPKHKFQVSCRIPDWLSPTDILEVAGDTRLAVVYNTRGDHEINIMVDELNISKQYLILVERRE